MIKENNEEIKKDIKEEYDVIELTRSESWTAFQVLSTFTEIQNLMENLAYAGIPVNGLLITSSLDHTNLNFTATFVCGNNIYDNKSLVNEVEDVISSLNMSGSWKELQIIMLDAPEWEDLKTAYYKVELVFNDIYSWGEKNYIVLQNYRSLQEEEDKIEQ